MKPSTADRDVSTSETETAPNVQSAGGSILAAPTELDWRSARLYRCRLNDAEPINDAIEAAVRQLGETDFDRRSHFVGGRFENLYLARTRIPHIQSVLDHTLACAALILERPVDALRCGFWLNLAAPGQGTSEHTHDEDDELLSAVYYVTVPLDSGDLILYDGPSTIRIEPEAGNFIFFPPTLPHAVEPNRSHAMRLSIGINIGPATPESRPKTD
jgi:hypothetical protein